VVGRLLTFEVLGTLPFLASRVRHFAQRTPPPTREQRHGRVRRNPALPCPEPAHRSLPPRARRRDLGTLRTAHPLSRRHPRPPTCNRSSALFVFPVFSTCKLICLDVALRCHLFSPFGGIFRPHLDQHVRAHNRLAIGERTVVVMSSEVAQKSYGTKKRFVASSF
jgi:hypothetical protein